MTDNGDGRRCGQANPPADHVDSAAAGSGGRAAAALRALSRPRPPQLPAPLAYASALAAVLVGTVLQHLLLAEPAIAPFLFFFPCVAVTSWIAGRLPGLLAVLLSALAGNYLFALPYQAWSLSTPALVATGFFAVASAVVAMFCASLRDAFLEIQRIGAEQKRAAAERERLMAALEDADRRKNQFLAVLSHELRNPLAPIRNCLYILDRAAAGSEQARGALAVIDRQVGHMTRLIDDLLDVTRISRGKIRLQRRQLDLTALLRRTVEDHRSLFAQRGIGLQVTFAGQALWVSADGTRLTQVVGNLLQNAAKFVSRGGRTAVSVWRDDRRDAAIISVRDTGIGIPPEMLPLMFEPFAQADSTLDRARGGLGLGLALVKGLVELHGGTVEAHSDGPGTGTEFTVRLPLGPQPAEAGPSFAAPRGRTRQRVLVIEDNADAAETLRAALEFGEDTVEVAFNGTDGIDKARSFKPDIVLCDIGLPGMDGYEVARAMRTDPELRAIPLVALTGYASPEEVARAREAGFDRHLPKPPSIERLELVLAEVGGAPR